MQPRPSRMLSFHSALEEKPRKRTMGDLIPKLLANSFQKNVPDATAQPYFMTNGFPLMQLQPRSVGSNHEEKSPVLTRPGHTAIFSASYPQVSSPVSRDTRAPKSPGAPAQLTIFFAGSVCVYEDVPPEKAEAIMSLARNSSPMCPSKTVRASQVHLQPPIMTPVDEGCGGKNSLMLSFPSSLVNTQQVNNTKKSIMTEPTLVQAAIPQARKVSLARFLERRKERMMIKASPYGLK